MHTSPTMILAAARQTELLDTARSCHRAHAFARPGRARWLPVSTVRPAWWTWTAAGRQLNRDLAAAR